MSSFFQIKACWFALGIAGALLTATAVQAQPSENGPNDERWDNRGREHFTEMIKKLNLSAEQQANLDEGRERNRKKFEAAMEGLHKKRQELRAELEKKELDMAKITRIHNELKALAASGEDQRLEAILEVRQILTPEQFTQFQKMMPDKKGPRPGKGRWFKQDR